MSLDGQFQKVPMVRFERTLPGPIERVWEFLTNTEQCPNGSVKERSSRARAARHIDGRSHPRRGHTVAAAAPAVVHMECLRSRRDRSRPIPNRI